MNSNPGIAFIGTSLCNRRSLRPAAGNASGSSSPLRQLIHPWRACPQLHVKTTARREYQTCYTRMFQHYMQGCRGIYTSHVTSGTRLNG